MKSESEQIDITQFVAPLIIQRTWGHAPKESYLADGDQFAEQPFGIQVKNQPYLLLQMYICVSNKSTNAQNSTQLQSFVHQYSFPGLPGQVHEMWCLRSHEH